MGRRRAEGRPAEAPAGAADADERLDLAADPRYSWPLLAAAARAVTVATAAAGGTTGAGAGRDGTLAAQAAGLLARLRVLSAQTDAFGPVQRANRLTYSAEALRAAAAGRGGAAAGRDASATMAAFDAAAAAWERT